MKLSPVQFLLTVVLTANIPWPIEGHGDHEHHGNLKNTHRRRLEGQRYRCSIRNQNPTASDRKAQARAVALAKLRARRLPYNEATVTTTVPVCIHFPILRNNRFTMSRSQIQENLEALNRGYSTKSCCDKSLSWCSSSKNTDGPCNTVDTGFEFKLAILDDKGKVTGTTDDVNDPNACVVEKRPSALSWLLWKFNMDAYEPLARVKPGMHKGDAKVLNLYFMDMGKNPLLGYSTLPWDYDNESEMDGVVINKDALVGGIFPAYDEGDTLVHETGHWLGLVHTFQSWEEDGDGCAQGDYVADTPAEAQAYFGCNAADMPVDTCPNEPGNDPIHNYMGYSDDACLYQWTKGQADVMRASYEMYRSRITDTSDVTLVPGVTSGPHTVATSALKMFILPGNETLSTQCVVKAENGNPDLYMGWDQDFNNVACETYKEPVESISVETCRVKPRSKTVYAGVFGFVTTVNFNITCSYV